MKDSTGRIVRRRKIKIPSINTDEIEKQIDIVLQKENIYPDNIISIMDEIYIAKKPGSTTCSSDDDIRWTLVTIWYNEL